MASSTTFFDTSARAGVNVHQFYSLDMPQTKSAALADIFAFEGTRGIGEPMKYVIRFTHPQHDLSRDEYLNKRAAFVIQPPPRDRWSQPESARRVHGVLTGFALLNSNRDQSTYEVVLESRLALLRGTRRCRFFLDMSEPEIVRQILKEHDFNQIFASFEFKLYREYRKRSFVMQWGEDDLTFLTRLCRRTGIWFVCEANVKREHVRFGDDFTHYRRDPALTVAYRERSGMETAGIESVSSLEMRATTVPKRHTVRTYHTERQPAEPIEASKDIHEDRTVYGEDYVWGTPYLTDEEAKQEALLRHEAALATQVEYHGTCDLLDLTPGSVLKLSNRTLPDAKHGLLAVRLTCRASRNEPYHVEFSAIPSDRLYRLPLLEDTWPRIEGVITGTVASSGGWRDPYLDEQGRYTIHIHPDRDTRTPGLQSCPMRLAKPFAGAGRTGFHFGLVEGTVVTVGFLWGNPDLPYISQVLHTAEDTDPIISGYPWATRNTIRTRSNNTFELDDRKGKEHIKLATEHGKTQLNLGYTVDRDQKPRGTGFELRTDGPGHVRAGEGVLVSADMQEKANGMHADMDPAMRQFESMQARVQMLAASAEASKAEVADLKAENAWLKNELAGLKKSVIALSAPNGIGVATPDRVMVSAGNDVSVASGAGFHLNALRRFTAAAGERLSLFAQRMGIKIFAAKGPVQIQAQSDLLSLAAEQDVTVSSVNGSVLMRARKEFIIECKGAFIKLANGCITLGAPYDLYWEVARFNRRPASQMHLGAPAFAPALFPFEVGCEAWRKNAALARDTSPASVTRDGAAAPAPMAGQTESVGGAADPAIPSDSRRVPNADLDAEHESKLPTKKDPSVPIQLDKAVYCNWHMPDIRRDCVDETETEIYQALRADRVPVGSVAGHKFPTAFELAYNGRHKLLEVTVRIKIVPVELFRADATGKEQLGRDGQKQRVPFHHDVHAYARPMTVDTPTNGSDGKFYVMRYRDGVGRKFDVKRSKQQVESVLNGHGSVLILDGCSKEAACGCRVVVRFRVEFLIGIGDAAVGDGKKIHKTIFLFPEAERADAGTWGEIQVVKGGAKDWGQFVSLPESNVVAHECGHLFNFPDEYWEWGGYVHKRYVKDGQLDFEAGEYFKRQEVWQIRSDENVMGYGANLPVSQLAGTSPSARAQPYYLEYIRRHFCEMTHKQWRIGYEPK
ncbi:hypothetical protein WM22_02075 [Burkholderia ubonensis]|uniref:type VI secretion system Vgr family protein n=1 Tax=Burkholderia ubonensis TaxID=101571 RepID=UPI000758E9B8|nr:type VI secretion system Vgr family protein [Burkholderia ubonensis]KWN01958.1 hypothetical protein WM19_08605 [Burkholderia ubonensis]KWN02240.1 hypothetical protein WM20_09450 [Burkholderia ubonensis]KWN31251.1 hypothetical protein WM22_02075 [Burkholderia ubonensis]ODQ27115.1 hypothetical protein BGV64_18740 [Burkholderia ubonensis]